MRSQTVLVQACKNSGFLFLTAGSGTPIANYRQLNWHSRSDLAKSSQRKRNPLLFPKAGGNQDSQWRAGLPTTGTVRYFVDANPKMMHDDLVGCTAHCDKATRHVGAFTQYAIGA